MSYKKSAPALTRTLEDKDTSKLHPDVKEGLQMILHGDYEKASKHFNTRLFDVPSDANVHYLNALSYHLRAKEGDVSMLDLAAEGFLQALKHDPNHTLAMLQLARVRTDQQRFMEAQETYASVLLSEPNHKEALYELALVSHKMTDMKTALMAIGRARELHPQDATLLKASALMYAAAGKKEQAQHYLHALKHTSHEKQPSLEKRIHDWQELYDKGLLRAQAEDESYGDESAQGAPAASENVCATNKVPYCKGEDTIVLDAVVLRIEETGRTSKGQNILDTFTFNLAPGSHFRGRGSTVGLTSGDYPIFYNSSGVGIPGGGFSAQPGNSSIRVFTRGLSFSTITYGLKIANAFREHIEIVGRPSLVTSPNKPAKFFSGQHLTMGLPGESGGSIENTPVGITLDVVPKDFDGTHVTLDIRMHGSILPENRLRDPTGSPLKVTETFLPVEVSSIQTSVRVGLGETIMLGGITERIDEDSKDGMPGLKDIPLIQLFFSQENTFSQRRSIMYMITPRSYQSVKKVLQNIQSYRQKGPNMKALMAKNKDWFKPDESLVVTLEHLEPLYREFRHADMAPLKWHMKGNIETNLDQFARMLFY